jgi:hypothetical protein
MSYICDYGHKHRTETGVEYCHVATPWREMESQIETTPWNPAGTTEEWSDLGQFRPLFWQYEPCGIFHEQSKGRWYHQVLEVHHIIPRRLGGTDHPANLISLCHDHHRIQPAHHHDSGVVLCDADIPLAPILPRRIRQPRLNSEKTLSDFGF